MRVVREIPIAELREDMSVVHHDVMATIQHIMIDVDDQNRTNYALLFRDGTYTVLANTTPSTSVKVVLDEEVVATLPLSEDDVLLIRRALNAYGEKVHAGPVHRDRIGFLLFAMAHVNADPAHA